MMLIRTDDTKENPAPDVRGFRRSVLSDARSCILHSTRAAPRALPHKCLHERHQQRSIPASLTRQRVILKGPAVLRSVPNGRARVRRLLSSREPFWAWLESAKFFNFAGAHTRCVLIDNVKFSQYGGVSCIATARRLRLSL